MNFISRDNVTKPSYVDELVNKLDEQARSFANPALTDQSFSLESMTDEQRRHVSSVSQSIELSLESIRNSLENGSSVKFTEAQIDAAKQAGVLAGGWKRFHRRALTNRLPAMGSENVIVMEAFSIPDAVTERSFATESYDESDNRSAVAYSIAYNMSSARQDMFGEALYPTITIPADQAGVSITTSIMSVMDNVERDISGVANDFRRKNILRAVADHTILRMNATRARPVNRAQSAANFVDVAVVPPIVANDEGANFNTGPLLFGRNINLIAISQTDALIATGVQNQTDSLDPSIDIEEVYISTGAAATLNVLKFNTLNLQRFNFVPNAQGNHKLLTLSAETDSILLNRNTTEHDGTPLVAPLNQIVNDDLTVRIRMVLSGNVTTDIGNITVYGNTFEVFSIQNAAGTSIALNDASVATLVAALNGRTFLGYIPKVFRSNMNRRQQGQFIDVYKEIQRHMVPLRSPITARHPAHTDGQIDASDVQALITATNIRKANEVVTTLIASSDALASYVDARDLAGESPVLLGVGRHFVRPAYIARPFDVSLNIDSQKSHERAADIQAALVNQIRDIVYTLYRDSEYKTASDAMYGGDGPLPTVVLATDPYTARYLMVVGDLRTLGGEFNVQVVHSLDVRMRGKIYITFAQMDGERNTSVNPLNNGNMFWAPELTLTANISRAGTFSKETMVQPRYLFVQNLPVMGLLTVTNIPNTLGKVPLNMVDVT